MAAEQAKDKQTTRVVHTSELVCIVETPLAVSTTDGAATGKETQPLQASDPEQSEVSTLSSLFESLCLMCMVAGHVQEWCL